MTCIDLHHFFFHRLEERSFSHTKQKHLQLLLYVNQHLAQAFSFIFVGFAPPVPKATVTDCHEKVQKSPKTGKKRRQCRKGNTQKISLLGKVCF